MATLCFVLMPFGTKTDGNQKEINFDNVYNNFIKKAIIEAGLEPIRADEEKSGGFIHKPMYERLMFCDFAVADLSFANANVFYELGIRHALKPYTTVSIFEANTKLPFDTAPLRTFPYNYENGKVTNVDTQIKELADRIKVNLDVRKMQQDSPIAQLITGYKFPNLNYLQEDADAFADKVINQNKQKEDISDAVEQWKDLEKVKGKATTEDEKNKIKTNQATIVNSLVKMQKDEGSGLRYNFDLMYSLIAAYKSVGAFNEITTMLEPFFEGVLKDNIYIKQQLAFAYNKIGSRDEAEAILKSITDQYGADPETNGLQGAVYKGLMDDNKDDPDLSAEYLRQAVNAYVDGFESDPRYYYPGINALTLMYFNDEPDERFTKLLPLVSFAVERQLKIKAKDYWVQVTLLELAALSLNEADAKKYLSASLTCRPENWMKETTAANLKKIYDKALQIKDEQSLLWLKNIAIKLNPAIF